MLITPLEVHENWPAAPPLLVVKAIQIKDAEGLKPAGRVATVVPVPPPPASPRKRTRFPSKRYPGKNQGGPTKLHELTKDIFVHPLSCAPAMMFQFVPSASRRTSAFCALSGIEASPAEVVPGPKITPELAVIVTEPVVIARVWTPIQAPFAGVGNVITTAAVEIETTYKEPATHEVLAVTATGTTG